MVNNFLSPSELCYNRVGFFVSISVAVDIMKVVIHGYCTILYPLIAEQEQYHD